MTRHDALDPAEREELRHDLEGEVVDPAEREELRHELEGEVVERVRAIPAGFVATYGDVSPGAPRFAGSVLFESHDPGLPWWRVVRADGSLAKGARQQRRLLEEGVPFRGDRVDMAVARAVLSG